MKIIGFFTLLLLCFCVAKAETVYVDARYDVMMRIAPMDDANVIVHLQHGRPLELLKTDASSGYSLVQTAKHSTGWVKTHYLSERKTHKPNILLRSWRASRDWMGSFKKQSPMDNVQHVSEKEAEAKWVRQTIQKLQQDQQQQKHYFIAGAVVAFLGVLMGYCFGMTRRRKKSRWNG